MLTMTGFKNFGFEIFDTTVSVLPGSARVGDKILNFDGTQALFSNLTNFGSETSVYQNTLLYLQNIGDLADMTQSLSDATSSLESLDIPALPTDASDWVHVRFYFAIFFANAHQTSLIVMAL